MVELRSYILSAVELVPGFVYWILIAVFGIGVIALVCSRGLREGLRMSSVLLLQEWIFVVFGITVFFREERLLRAVNLIPLNSYFHYAKNTYLMEVAAINILNVALFIPVGLLSGYGFRNITWQRVLTIGALLSVFIEILQLALKCGLCETDDVIHNTAGCMAGYGVFKLCSWCRERRFGIQIT